MRQQNHFDSIVIGGGSAGSAFANTAANLGGRILLIERGALGGTCVNRGCVPKKILWAAGRTVRNAVASYECNILDSAPRVDFGRLVARRDARIAEIRQSFDDRLNRSGVTVVRGEASLLDARTLRVGDKQYHAKNTVIATGAVPVMPQIEGADYLANSTDVLSWRTLPRDMVILGGGYIGTEFASIFNALGVDVTLIETDGRILAGYPTGLADHVIDSLRAAGVRVLLHESLNRIEKINDRLAYALRSGADGTADAIVAATGRTPDIAQLGPFAGGLRLAESGALAVDDQFMTSAQGVYAIGDAADRMPLTPVAKADGTTLAKILHGSGCRPIDLDLVPKTAFSYPPAAVVGKQADGPFAENTVIRLADQVLHPQPECTRHYYRLDADTQDRIIGAQFMSDGAEDMIALASALIAAQAPRRVLTQATGIHPSFAEEFFPDTVD